MMRRSSLAAALGCLALAGAGRIPLVAQDEKQPPFRGVLIAPAKASDARLAALRREGFNAVALDLEEPGGEAAGPAARRVSNAGLSLYYWVEVGRCPALADAHPGWMASLQGHPGWRRHFPKAPVPNAGEVVKNYPWVPVSYRETFDAHRERVGRLLKPLPAPKGIFLNDLQAAPAACGCGNRFCRWTPDYGPIRTATPLGADAAARFVSEVARLAPGAAVIPVWATECEEHEMPKGAACDGVPCYSNTCWHAWTEQLMPVAQGSPTLGVLATYRALGRDDPRYGAEAAWVRQAIASFSEMPPRRKGQTVRPDRLIAVLQGWDVTSAQRQAQIQQTTEAGAGGYLLAETAIDQEWTPRLVRVPPATATPPQQDAAPSRTPPLHALPHRAGAEMR